MFCSQCGCKLAAPGEVCEVCAGPRSASAAPRAGSGGPDAGPLLARANLLRMRGLWNEAAEQCSEVLRLQPGNPTAHSLLGDIYQDQGRAEEARHWFQLALELNPGSRADRAKLARAEEAIEARVHRAEWEAMVEGRAQPVSAGLQLRESLQRVGALAGAALCGIVLVMATLVGASERNGTSVDPDQPGTFSFMRGPASMQPDTPLEEELTRKVNSFPNNGGGQLLRLEYDPRTDTAALRVYLPQHGRDPVAIPEFRVDVMREAYRFAYAAHSVDRRIRLVNVSVVGPQFSTGQRPQTNWLFIATVSEDNLVVTPEKVSPDELRKFFSAVSPAGWGPQIAPY